MRRFEIITTVLLMVVSNTFGISAPTPLSVGIDLGWKQGWSTDIAEDPNKPWHIDMQTGRWMVLEDYEAIVYIAKAVKTRLQCLFIMSEFDRSNICAEYPTTTEQGKNWDNSALVSDDDFKIMNYVKEMAVYIEFGLHGVRHEHWEYGVKTRAEFACGWKNRKPWPYSDMQCHMECFKRLIDQYGITFPKSFVPPANCYYYNPSEPNDTGGLMSSWGIKYAARSKKLLKQSGMDNGLLVLRRHQEIPWRKSIGIAPTRITTDLYYECTHWHNYLEMDPADNHKAGDRWIKWFNMIKDSPDRYLPKNTAQLFSQYLYKTYSDIKIYSNTVTIDNTKMPDWAHERELLGNLLFKLPLKTGIHVSSASLNNANIACYYEDRGFGYIILPRLNKSKYTLIYSIGTSEMLNYVLNDGTYNVNKFETTPDKVKISLEMYGTQDVKVKLDYLNPTDVKSSTKSLIINSWKWDSPTHTLVVNVTATDIQGIEGDLIINRRY